MTQLVDSCPQSFDLEPMCLDIDPQRAIEHARGVCTQVGIPEESVRVALGVVVPNADNPKKILYGLRRPEFHTEYKETWGLPSIGLATDDFLRSSTDPSVYQKALSRLSEIKLENIPLFFQRTIAWTGRIRLAKNDPQFAENYYLIMVDVKTNPLSPNFLPESSKAYAEFQWLTPDEHTALIMQTPTHACGACSDLASLASRLGKL